MSAMGNHLSGNVQAGRCRIRRVRAKTSSRYSGGGAADRSSRSPAGCARGASAGHATCPPGPATGTGVRFDREPHLAEGAMQARLDRADRDAERRRDVGQRHPEEVVQDDDRPTALVEPAHGRVDDRGLRPHAGMSIAIKAHRSVELDFDDAASPMAGGSRQALTVRRWSQASKRSGSRNPGRRAKLGSAAAGPRRGPAPGQEG